VTCENAIQLALAGLPGPQINGSPANHAIIVGEHHDAIFKYSF